MKTKSALSYFGSDSEVAERLAAKLGHCKHVTIPFVGGGSIIPHLKARAIVCNDLNESAITFYRVVSGVFGATERDALIKRCRRTLSHPHELITAHRTLIGDDVFSPVDHAWAYWSLCWVARKGQGGTKNHGGLPSVRRSANGGTNASRIRAAADDLEAWPKRSIVANGSKLTSECNYPKSAMKLSVGSTAIRLGLVPVIATYTTSLKRIIES